MLEYEIDDADTLLTTNRENAIKSLEDVKQQLGKNIWRVKQWATCALGSDVHKLAHFYEEK